MLSTFVILIIVPCDAPFIFLFFLQYCVAVYPEFVEGSHPSTVKILLSRIQNVQVCDARAAKFFILQPGSQIFSSKSF